MTDSLPRDFDLDALCEVFRSAEKPPERFRLGLESEKFGLHSDGLPLAYAGEDGVEGLFADLRARGYTPTTEVPDGPVLGLHRGDESITLEPAAQVELSGAPQLTVHELSRELHGHLADLEAARGNRDLYFLHLGFHPLARPEAFSWVPKLRYPIMRSYLPKRGRRGLDMMQRTATVQVNLDYENERDAMLRLVTLLKVTPFLQAMTLNAPFFEGGVSQLLSERLDVWLNMDPDRSGMVPDVWKPNATYRDYATWAARAPMFLFMRGTQLHENTGQTFEAFWKDGFEGEHPTFQDWKTHLGTLFPEVRLKTTLEVRGVDSQAPDLALALPAFLAGLSYDTQSLQAAASLLESLDLVQAEELRRRIRTDGLSTPWNGTPVQKTAMELLDLAYSGLSRRASFWGFADESDFLTPLRELVERGTTPAERTLRAFRDSGLDLSAFVRTLASRE
jgi:glutamate--cysteine ligase